MNHITHRLFPAAPLLALVWFVSLAPFSAHAQSIAVPDQLTPSLSLNEIRIGMKGYGMTVFHGTKIEPFNVEVVSVIPNSSPTRSVIWVRCPDARMIESGPVQGMSGSPIFLWGENEPHELGKGGKLIGAFAFGYAESQQCMVGVQPIDYMRESATRAPKEGEQAGTHQPGRTSTQRTIELLDNLNRMAGGNSASSLSRTRIKLMRDVLLRASGRAPETSESAGTDVNTVAMPGPRAGTTASTMLLPISLGSARCADFFAPLLEPMGLLAVAGDATPIAGAPPHGIDPSQISLEPGGVLAIPLAYGDLDLSASGTVTDILPTGEVLAFGHPMFGLGSANVPMATGYVHFVMPRRSISFKSSGSLIPLGTLVRDESAAVVGVSGARYTTAPVEVTAKMPGQPAKTYHYQVVNEPLLSAMLIANVAFYSFEADYGLPIENTFHLQAEMRFTGGRAFKIDTVIAGGSAVDAVMEVLPPVSIMVHNPYESLDVESVSVSIDVEEGIRMGSIIGARLERSEVAPGDEVGILLDIQHYAGETEHRRIVFKIPDDLDEGDYPLSVNDANSYARMKIGTQPHLMVTNNIDDLAEFIQETMSYKNDAIYAVLQLPDGGLALGRTPMPHLPSSRAAILTSPTVTDAVPYPALIDQVYDADYVISGQVGFTLSVRKP
ncbi:MAG: hypothetical protein R3C45_08770 [Phycisphaerales bacterium]